MRSIRRFVATTYDSFTSFCAWKGQSCRKHYFTWRGREIEEGVRGVTRLYLSLGDYLSLCTTLPLDEIETTQRARVYALRGHPAALIFDGRHA